MVQFRLALVLAPPLFVLAGCADTPFGPAGPAAPAAPAVAPAGAAPARIAPQGARTAAAFDRTSAAEKAAARAVVATSRDLGTVTASLGNPAEQGFWLRSDLVKAKTPGVVKTAAGASVQVDLLPLSGGGPQLSLAAYRSLGLALTDLPRLSVHSR